MCMSNSVKCILLLVLLQMAANAAEDRIDFLVRKLRERGPHDYAMVIAHRGDWRFGPENSLEGFENCIRSGFDAIEVDVRMTKDGVLVVMHDESVNRTTNGKGKVSDLTYAEIKKMRRTVPCDYFFATFAPQFLRRWMLAKRLHLLNDYETRISDHSSPITIHRSQIKKRTI